MTLKDHMDAGNAPPEELHKNPGKTLAETMSDEEIRAHMLGGLGVLLQVHKEIIKGLYDKKIFEVPLRNYFLPDVEYLRSIGRLPKELEDFDPDKIYHA